MDGEWIGYVTSASQGFRMGKLLALGYVKHGSLGMGGRCAISVLGRERAAIRHDPAQYDPENRRLKA